MLITNPQRLDYENTVRIRVQNIPLSADDGTITRELVLKGLEVITISREKLRIDGRLTNCETGDRIVIVKASTLSTPLNRFMNFGQFNAQVIHRGQVNKNLKCSKCLEVGHTIHTCKNDWKCTQCSTSGHKRGQCEVNNTSSVDPSEASESSSEDEQTQTTDTKGAGGPRMPDIKCADSASGTPKIVPTRIAPETPQVTKSAKRKNKQKQTHITGQQNMDKYVERGKLSETPNKQKCGSIVRSSPTPAEILHDESKKPGKHYS